MNLRSLFSFEVPRELLIHLYKTGPDCESPKNDLSILHQKAGVLFPTADPVNFEKSFT